MLPELITVILCYFIGSIPFSFLAAKLVKNIDLRKVGNKNIGATNAFKSAGFITGAIAVVGDAGKGIIAVFIAQKLLMPLYIVLACGFFAVIGHNWPVFLKFKGGRGLATSFGVVAYLMPLATAITALFWICIALIKKDFRFRGFLFSMLVFPFLAIALYKDPYLVIFGFVIVILLWTMCFRDIREFARWTL